MKKLLIGTHNLHKTREISALLQGTPWDVVNLSVVSEMEPVEETGATLEENAVLKARYYAEKTGLFTLSDDTGLEVDALDGAPGVFSARFAGENCSFSDNNQLLLQKLKNTPEEKRTATFRCVIACCDPSLPKVSTVEGRLEGFIALESRGKNGFGYDPVFFLPKLGKTLAELSSDEKNALSHRAIALQKAKVLLSALGR